eukprot:scaffold45133_cov30-Tisochrysis_lutea.AAC.2
MPLTTTFVDTSRPPPPPTHPTFACCCRPSHMRAVRTCVPLPRLHHARAVFNDHSCSCLGWMRPPTTMSMKSGSASPPPTAVATR